MNTLKAAEDTIHKIYQERALLSKEGPCSYPHLAGMVIQMQKGNFSEGKINRWLGYMQGVAVANGLCSLEEVKEINRRNANGQHQRVESDHGEAAKQGQVSARLGNFDAWGNRIKDRD